MIALRLCAFFSILTVTICFAETAIVIQNPRFENGLDSWSAGDRGMTALNAETPHSGTNCIRVVDMDTGRGSSLASASFSAQPNTLYRVRFWGRPILGSGVAVYLQFFDDKGKMLTNSTRRNEINITIPKGKKEWKQHTLTGESPEGTGKGRIWVHSYNGAKASADLDDFELSVLSKEEAEKAKMAIKKVEAEQVEFPVRKPERIAEIATLLKEKPEGLGVPITNRETWDALRKMDGADRVIKVAEDYLETPPPELPDDLYLEFTRTGNRTHYQAPYGKRPGRIGALAKAECLENKGRFLSALERDILAMCDERSWVMPAHDSSLGNFKGTHLTIDLGSSARAWLLATCDYWLGERLSASVRERIRAEITRRIFDPYLASIRRGATRGNWWIKGTNNWNAVCTANVIGTALALVEKAEGRAEFLAGMEISNPYFLKGFTADGYCSEGMGYWNYGFGHYMMLGYTVDRATDGKLNIFEAPILQNIAAFARNIQIEPGMSPAFADCGVGARPSSDVLVLIKRYFPDAVPWDVSINVLGGSPVAMGIYAMGGFVIPEESTIPELPLRSWFPDAGILVSRSPATAEKTFGTAIKGGHNAEHHNHNDVGSFLIVSNGKPFLLDPGGEVYTRRTFSRERYVSNMLNSYGHPVPVVAGKLQKTGRDAAGKILVAEFSDAEDKIVIDMTAAYDVPELKSLVRTFVHNRDTHRITMVDEVSFTSPQEFSTALVTYERVYQAGPEKIYVYDDTESLKVDLQATGGNLTITEESIENPGRQSPTRIGLVFAEPVTQASVAYTIAPAGLVKGMPGLYWAPEEGEGFQPDTNNAIIIEAEDFSGQAGGEVSVCEKLGASGKTFKFWDDEGHSLSWSFETERAGKYAIQTRYCQGNGDASHRTVSIDGNILSVAGNADALFPTTGGWSSKTDDWRDLWLAVDGEALIADLQAGKHTITMNNTCGRGVNLDLIRIVPVK